MTEEIIIDGVDVAGCEYYKGKCMEYTHYCQIGCKECTDIGIKLCHYKQTERFKAKITRLEQENKELKKQIESDKGLITVGGKQQYEYLQKIDELEQENKELKELNKKICEDWEKEIKVYWNALEEIRRTVIDIIEDNGRHNLSDFSSPIRIEKIINEVLDKG